MNSNIVLTCNVTASKGMIRNTVYLLIIISINYGVALWSSYFFNSLIRTALTVAILYCFIYL